MSVSLLACLWSGESGAFVLGLCVYLCVTLGLDVFI